MTNKDDPQQNHDDIAAIRRRIKRPIVLVGMMGVGKSTVGRNLAELLDWSFVDADDEIEKAAQLSVSEIFEKYGEAQFRNGEMRVIARLMEDNGQRIIATGGGAFCQPQTRQAIQDKAISVWLDCDLDTLVERVTRRDTRPLLRGGDPRQILTDLLDKRQDDYAQAHVRVQCVEGPHRQMAVRILETIDQWL